MLYRISKYGRSMLKNFHFLQMKISIGVEVTQKIVISN